MADVDDSDLLAAIARGDEEAMRHLHAEHASWIRRRLLRRFEDGELVEEAIQDTFMTVWHKPNAYRGEGEVGAWLWGIAIRRLIDLIRRRRRQPSTLVGSVRSAEDEALVGLEFGEFAGILERLPQELLGVVRATILDGLTTREAAVLLGIPQGTVKTRMVRARALLREEFG
ncbi:MAG: sigma-70 family RNA polymerase sigma factor [Acidimicrobiia bacterium]|nr:sigma-70 family RNA polymerase sigma factor [Acidimicrobiia bacterium]